MGATSGRRARVPAQADAEEAFDPEATTEMKPPPDSQGPSLRPERRWAQLGAAGMDPPPGGNPLAQSLSQEAEPEFPTVLEDDSSALSRPVTQIAIGSIVGVVVVALIMALSSRGFPPADRPGDGGILPAGSFRAATSPAPTMAVGGATSLQETFDELPINGVPPEPWQVRGDGSVAIVALPTSVDRSVRLRSTRAGATTALCRPTEVGTATGLRVAVDYVLGRAGVGEVVLVTLKTAGAGSIELLIGPTGAPVGVKGPDGGPSASSPPAAPPSPPAGSAGLDWQRLVIDVDPRAGAVSWVTHDTSGAETATGTAAVGIAREAIGTVCLHSPAASAGWIAIDDLIIEG
jgi:hypothetical protein